MRTMIVAVSLKGSLVQRELDFAEGKRLRDCSVSAGYNPSDFGSAEATSPYTGEAFKGASRIHFFPTQPAGGEGLPRPGAVLAGDDLRHVLRGQLPPAHRQEGPRQDAHHII